MYHDQTTMSDTQANHDTGDFLYHASTAAAQTISY